MERSPPTDNANGHPSIKEFYLLIYPLSNKQMCHLWKKTEPAKINRYVKRFYIEKLDMVRFW